MAGRWPDDGRSKEHSQKDTWDRLSNALRGAAVGLRHTARSGRNNVVDPLTVTIDFLAAVVQELNCLPEINWGCQAVLAVSDATECRGRRGSVPPRRSRIMDHRYCDRPDNHIGSVCRPRT